MEEVIETLGFARKNETGRETDRRLATRRLRRIRAKNLHSLVMTPGTLVGSTENPAHTEGARVRRGAFAHYSLPLKRRAALQARFDFISAELPRAEWTDAVSRMFGRIKAALERRGTRIEDFDAAIAAHALALDATLVTANLGHMIRVPGLRVEDWSR